MNYYEHKVDWRRDFWMMSQNGVSIHYCPSPVV